MPAKAWRRDPLLHFLLLGAVLYLFYAAGAKAPLPDRHIVFDAASVERLRAQWKKDNGAYPDAAAMRNLIEQRVRDEILYREAKMLGLADNDIIVRRRLVQKLDFLLGDPAQLHAPSEAQLRDYFAAHRQHYLKPARLSFGHVYFSADRPGANAQAAARARLATFAATAPPPRHVQAYGDPFMLPTQYVERTQAQIAGVFGKAFAAALMALPSGRWQGPVVSGFGVHLVYVYRKTAPSVPDLAAVRDDVARDYLAQQMQDLKRDAYRHKRDLYRVDVATPD